MGIEKIFCKFCKSEINPTSSHEYSNGYHDDCFKEVDTYQKDPDNQFDVFYDIYGQRTKSLNKFILGSKLTELYLDKLDIDVLSDSIGCFHNLQTLVLNENKLSDIPLTISKTLTRLELKKNLFTSIPPIISSLDKLEDLYLSDNEITDLPETIGNLTNLVSFNLSNNTLSSLPQSFSKLGPFDYLLLSGNNFSTFPLEITNLSIYHLDLGNNKITSLPRAIKNIGVHSLILDHNLLQSLTDEIGEIDGINNLSLEWNKLSYLPSTLGNLYDLSNLNVEGNKLANLPDSLVDTSLARINLSNNKFKIMPSCILQLERLKYFYFNNMQLFVIPKEFFKPNLVEVAFSNCGLQSLPDSIGMSSNLRSLNVSFNDLNTLPDSICNLSLVRLDITNNPIKKLPDELTNVKYLYANNTKLELLPESIAGKIVECHLKGTNIQSLPDFNPEKDPEKYLEIIDIRDTPLKIIPESISKVKINRIYISKNDSLRKQLKDHFRGSSNALNCEIIEDPQNERGPS